MSEDSIIELIGDWFESKQGFHEVYSLRDVESVYREVEKFCEENNIYLESDIAEEDFEELVVSEDEDERTEVKFEIPIGGTDLILEFYYYRSDEKEYRIKLDIDYYFDLGEEFDF